MLCANIKDKNLVYKFYVKYIAFIAIGLSEWEEGVNYKKI